MLLLLIVGGVALIAGTIVEDVVTGSVGILDDPVTPTAGATMIDQDAEYFHSH
jgi:hypothetical protein